MWASAQQQTARAAKRMLFRTLPASVAFRVWLKLKPVEPVDPTDGAEQFESLLLRAWDVVREIQARSLIAAWDGNSRVLVLSPETRREGHPVAAAEIVLALEESHPGRSYRLVWQPGSPLGLSALLGPEMALDVAWPQAASLHSCVAMLLLGGCLCLDATARPFLLLDETQCRCEP
jgi:hypothetical protein